MRSEPLLAAAVACGLALVTAGAAGEGLTLNDGAFTAVQAERGAHVYDAHCLACHNEDFYRAKLLVWQSATVAELFDALVATMPSENPGALSDAEYLDVLAYIFSITGSPAGEHELTLDNMEAVEIVAAPAD